MKENEIDFYPIEGFEHYLLAKDGDNEWSVWSNKRGELKEMKGWILRSGHRVYGLCTDGKQTNRALHVLIAEMFIPIPQKLLDSGEKLNVHHLDHNAQNNTISNLVWMTESEHRRLHKKGNKNMLGKHHSEEAKKKMSETKKGKIPKANPPKQVYQYDLEGNLVRVWESTCECGRNGFNQGHVAECCRGEFKQHKGYRWSYEPL